MVIFFIFNVLSASMNAFIFFCQIASSCPSMISQFSNFAYFTEEHLVYPNINVISVTIVMSAFMMCGTCNEFFFMYHFVSSFKSCLLTLLWLCILWYDCFNQSSDENFEVIQFLWRPVVWLSNYFNHHVKSIKIKLSQVFATFILLSYST